MSAHTPGGWRFHPPTGIVAEDGTVVASVYYTAGTPGKCERVANARLIAAAPVMLKALEDLVSAVESPDSASLTELRAARAAIAKAKGTQ